MAPGRSGAAAPSKAGPRKPIPISFSTHERALLQRVAEREGISMAAVVRKAVRQMVGERVLLLQPTTADQQSGGERNAV